MAKKEVIKFLQKTGVVAGILGGVAGGILTMQAMDNYSTTHKTLDAKYNLAVNSSARVQMIEERETAIYDAYKKGIIDVKTFTSEIEKLHSNEFVYENRSEFLSKKDADEWTKAKNQEGRVALDLLGSSIFAGATLAGAGLLAIKRGYGDLEEAKQNKENEAESMEA